MYRQDYLLHCYGHLTTLRAYFYDIRMNLEVTNNIRYFQLAIEINIVQVKALHGENGRYTLHHIPLNIVCVLEEMKSNERHGLTESLLAVRKARFSRY